MRAATAGVSKIAEQPPDRQHTNQSDKTDNADRNIAFGNWQRVALPRFARARRCHRAGKSRIMRDSPAPTDESADDHRNSNRQTDQVPDAEKSKRQKEIVTAHCAA